MVPLSSYGVPCHSPFQEMSPPTTQSADTSVPNMYSLMISGLTSASHTCSAGAEISSDTFATIPRLMIEE